MTASHSSTIDWALFYASKLMIQGLGIYEDDAWTVHYDMDLTPEQEKSVIRHINRNKNMTRQEHKMYLRAWAAREKQKKMSKRPVDEQTFQPGQIVPYVPNPKPPSKKPKFQGNDGYKGFLKYGIRSPKPLSHPATLDEMITEPTTVDRRPGQQPGGTLDWFNQGHVGPPEDFFVDDAGSIYDVDTEYRPMRPPDEIEWDNGDVVDPGEPVEPPFNENLNLNDPGKFIKFKHVASRACHTCKG